ncbi:uncharacterized protein [Rutidosis leptorrhynchoides]|uniref:uncharacterized protein n=1 Tax=Rutidosis leptorrhynchoides TaxID=125765 RepID=UPI003A99647F
MRGTETLFWHDKWIGEPVLKQAFPKLFRLESNKLALVSDRLQWTGSEGRVQFSWQWSTLPRWRILSDLQQLENRLSVAKCSGRNVDNWVWKPCCSGIYTTKSLIEMLNSSVDTHVKPTIRNNLIPQKVGILMWRASQNKLPVRSELDRRGIDLDSVRCPACDDDIESINHSVILCKTAFDIWERIYKWWNLNLTIFADINELIKGSNSQFHTATGASIWQAIVWVTSYYIWKNRNDHVFNKM